MPLYLTASHTSRIRKSDAKLPALRRSTSSPFSTLPRRKPIQQTKSVDQHSDNSAGWQDEKLDVTGTPVSLAVVSSLSGAVQAINHSHATIFCDIPERAGMNSTRIAEVLNYRKGLPSIVSVAHIHGLITTSTRTEREIAALIASGHLRKLTVSGRGNDISGLGEFLILFPDLKASIEKSSLDPSVADKFIELLTQRPRSTTIPAELVSSEEVTALRNAGFLVSPAISRKSNAVVAGANHLAITTISRQASGTIAAVGGEAAFNDIGGGGSTRTFNSESSSGGYRNELTLSVPNMGVCLRLINDARTHLLDLLGKSKYREAPLYLLRERWDGAVESGSKASREKRIRGEFAGILPGKTRKWKLFYGLNFDWVLEECVGAGLIELFDTGSVGHGVRAI